MSSSNGRPTGPPVWAIRLCKWLWEVQGRFWRILVASYIIEIIINLIANISLASQPLSVLQQAALVNLMLQHIGITLAILAIIAICEFAIYMGSHLPLPASRVAASTPYPLPRPLLPARWYRMFGLILAALLVVTLVIWVGTALLHKPPAPPDKGIGIVAGGIGVCDGSCFFDTQRINGTLKQEAVASMRAGHLDDAYRYWGWAADEDTTDAEAKILLADTHIQQTKMAHMTFVVTVSLTGNQTQIDGGRDILQGAYIRQKEYNDAHPIGPQMYLLIANMGRQDSTSQQAVADRLLQAAREDATIIGVTGLPSDSGTLIDALSHNNIPMVSMASLSRSTKIPHLLSVAPTLTDEAQAAATYISNTLHVGRVFVAFESGDAYSTDLKNAFVGSFQNTLTGVQSYAGGSNADLSGIGQEAVSSNSDLIYFAGPPADASILLGSLRGVNSPPMVMGGDIIYRSIHSPTSDRANFNGLLFTAFSYPDEWSQQHMQQPAFVTDYWQAFDPDRQHAGNPYTFSRAGSDTILSYDALSLLISASDIVLYKEKLALSSEALWNALTQFTPSNQLQGVSGQISFADANSTPDGKAVLVLTIQPAGTRSLALQTGTYSCASTCYKEASG